MPSGHTELPPRGKSLPPVAEMKRHFASKFALGLSLIEWFSLLTAIGMACGFFWRTSSAPFAFDAAQYLTVADDIARTGVLGKFIYSNLRTYGYPWFLNVLTQIANAQGIGRTVMIFEVQLALYIGSVALVRHALRRHSPTLARLVFCALLLNIFALCFTPEPLTESLSITLLLLAAALWVWQLTLGHTWPGLAVLFLGGLTVGFSVVVRPANLYLLIAWTICSLAVCLVRWRSYRSILGALMATLGIALPLAPQLAINSFHYGKMTPFPVMGLAQFQQAWGIKYIKWATAVPPVSIPDIRYENPLAIGTVNFEQPLDWYFKYPLKGLGTLALHVFNMLDQDLFFTYSRDLDPWYRLPVGILNHAIVALAIIALGILVKRMFDKRENSALRLGAFALTVMVASHLLVHAPAAVEMRYGLPLLTMSFPLAAWMIHERVRDAGQRRRLGTLAFTTAYVIGALLLSSWVRNQAPVIRAWEESHRPNSAGRAKTRWQSQPDINGDGTCDLVFQNSTTGLIYSWMLSGRNFVGHGPIGTPPKDWTPVSMADIDGNGKSDILFRDREGAVRSWQLEGLTMTDVGFISASPGDLTISGTGDLDGDGKADIIFRQPSGAVTAWLLNGASVARAGPLGKMSTDWTIAGIADINGDGKVDIIFRHASGQLSAWLVDGLNVRDSVTFETLPPEWRVEGFGDLDGDGKADLILRNTTSHAVQVWFLNGPTVLNRGPVENIAEDWSVMQIADLDGDGRADIMIQNKAGTVEALLMNGLSITNRGTVNAMDRVFRVIHK